MARPRKEFNWDEFDKLCGIHATQREVADWFEMSEDTVERRIREQFDLSFAEYVKQRQAPGKISLRRKQYEMAMNGNITMLIWLGKQYLGQADKQEHGVSEEAKQALKLAYPSP